MRFFLGRWKSDLKKWSTKTIIKVDQKFVVVVEKCHRSLKIIIVERLSWSKKRARRKRNLLKVPPKSSKSWLDLKNGQFRSQKYLDFDLKNSRKINTILKSTPDQDKKPQTPFLSTAPLPLNHHYTPKLKNRLPIPLLRLFDFLHTSPNPSLTKNTTATKHVVTDFLSIKIRLTHPLTYLLSCQFVV